jgi:hypothetical protein
MFEEIAIASSLSEKSTFRITANENCVKGGVPVFIQGPLITDGRNSS